MVNRVLILRMNDLFARRAGILVINVAGGILLQNLHMKVLENWCERYVEKCASWSGCERLLNQPAIRPFRIHGSFAQRIVNTF